MWKKVLMVIVAFVGTFSVVYAVNHEMKAASYALDTKLYGKLGLAGIGPNGAGSIEKTDKLLLKTVNSKTGKPFAWQLILKNGNEWMTLSDSSIASTTMVNDSTPYKTQMTGSAIIASIDDSNAYPYYESLNKELLKNGDTAYMEEFDNTIFDTASSENGYNIFGALAKNSKIYAKTGTPKAYHMSYYAMSTAAGVMTTTLGIPNSDLTYGCEYWNLYNSYSKRPYVWSFIGTDGGIRDDIKNTALSTYDIRPMLSFKTSFIDNIVFAISQSSTGTSTYAEILNPTVSGYTSLYSATSHINGMKARIHNPAISITFHDILNTKDQATTKIKEKEHIKFKVDATLGNDADNSPYTISDRKSVV